MPISYLLLVENTNSFFIVSSQMLLLSEVTGP